MFCGTSLSSGLRTADAAVHTGRGTLNGVLIGTDGTNSATLTIYDNASSATGDVVFKAVVAATNRTKDVIFNVPVRCVNGLYCDIQGTGAEYIVYHSGG